MSINNLEQFCEVVRRRTAMYLPNPHPNQRIGQIATIAGFVQLMLFQECFTLPEKVKVKVFDDYFFLTAENCHLRLHHLLGISTVSEAELKGGFIDWLITTILSSDSESMRTDFTSFVFLSAIICSSNFCQVDISSDTQQHFRQTFYDGTAISPLEMKNEINTPYVSLHLTAGEKVFNITEVHADDVISAINGLRDKQEHIKHDFDIEYSEQNHIGFEIHIQPQRRY